MDTPITISDRTKPECQSKHLTIGALIFPRMDQIDFTGPFEVLSRIPDSTIHVIAKTKSPVRDIQGLILTPEMAIAEVPEFDILLVPGGYGQQQLMNDEEVLSLIRSHFAAGRLLFSVCTGALLCGAAGVLHGRQATTHWAAWDLLPCYGATPIRSRVVVDGNLVTAAGVTAGLDAALVVASLSRGDAIAQEIQLSIQYAPNPVFHSGSPDTAPAEVLQAFNKSYSTIGASREVEARRFAAGRDNERASVLEGCMADTKTLIQQAYSAFNKRDIDGALALMTQDVSWPKASEGGKVIGKEDIRAYWTRQWSEFDPHVEPFAITEGDGGKVRVRVHQLVKSLKGDVLSDTEVLHVFTMNCGLIAAMDLGDEANTTAGPSAAFAQIDRSTLTPESES